MLDVQKTVAFVIIGFSVFLFSTSASALMESDSFTIWADTVSSGGNRSTSAGYIVDDTIGESATGEDQESDNYFALSGLPAIFQEPVLTFDLSDDAIELSPDLQTDEISDDSYTLTISTNAQFGFNAQVIEDGNFRDGADEINDVADGEVTAGSEEYGLAVTGDDADFIDDEAIPDPAGTALIIATRDNWVSNSVTTVTHKASVSGSSAHGDYSHVVTYIVIGNF